LQRLVPDGAHAELEVRERRGLPKSVRRYRYRPIADPPNRLGLLRRMLAALGITIGSRQPCDPKMTIYRSRRNDFEQLQVQNVKHVQVHQAFWSTHRFIGT
jgi:hypothetical protein